jgi:hypothetical protein
MIDCIIYLSPPNIKKDFELHQVVYLIHIYLNHIPQLRWYTLEINETKIGEEKINIDKEGFNNQNESQDESGRKHFG